ncbi:putative adipose-regulatory protein-domain-containing protein [Xylaria sp. FL0933]|nr:putative adipose-regulatory protein-domain-containing protein [Xylaria sp. FL0933]
MQYIKAPYHAATSSTAKRTYLGAALFVSASAVLLAIAALAYPIFYYNYVPKKLITVPIHLQYDAGLNPYGIVTLTPDLMLEQAYDVSVDLTLPRSPANLERGNFMVALYALKSIPSNPAFDFSTPPAASTFTSGSAFPYEHVTRDNVVFSSRRPVLIPYEDPLVSTASRVLFLLYHIFFAHAAETVKLSIPMGELVQFKSVLPLSVLVDVQAGPTLQVYSSAMTLVARLSGMRWFMYNHRVLAFAACTTIFWMAEMVSMGLAWVMLRWFFSGGRDKETGSGVDTLAGYGGESEGGKFRQVKYEDDHVVKKEEEDEDDMKIKEETPEPESESTAVVAARDKFPRHAGDADDEGGSEDGWEVSGTGTSFHDSRSSSSGQVRRRTSRGGGTA